ncbi:hypothetical protein OGAPHI_001004 [Ogataea philodendri]|uniref:Formate/nitrite transporter n=1 Tax=Ogataea philodendri TaxID=1378263 RepID=A0A9P8T9E1_9ASCO|nr:uncharacterized protein OGAPHI_001004 [Ogataea philodendri]KAH3670489.1 hypothetical protein OGAPHI_001004 [Ogataea philodendri]
MVDDTYYITVHEAALAVVATAMKKSRLRPHLLVINSIMGAFLFCAGGMLDLMVQSLNPGLMNNGYAGIVSLLQGAVYSIGLFFVITMGMELFNSNVLFFSVGVLQGAVTIMDLIVSWMVSLWVNLASTVFVVYVFGHVSGVTSKGDFVEGSRTIAEFKESFSFMQTFLKSIAGNFFVCLAVYLQIMVKPLHVKFLMIFLPIFTFVAFGFTHVVADMFLIPAGLFNKCSFGWGRYFWKLFLPASLGNMIGGSFFGMMIPWYLHLVVIEQDRQNLHLPDYDERDEQPQLNMDSRVVRTPRHSTAASISTHNSQVEDYSPLERMQSPKGVFPVYDMGDAPERERSIADPPEGGVGLQKVLTRASWRRRQPDIEAQRGVNTQTETDSLGGRIARHFSTSSALDDRATMRQRLQAAGVTRKIANYSNDIAGIHQDSIVSNNDAPNRNVRKPSDNIDPAQSPEDSSLSDEKHESAD